MSRLDWTYAQLTRPGEVLSVFVEAGSHDSISGIEGLLDAIPMVNVDVDIEYPRMIPITASASRKRLAHRIGDTYRNNSRIPNTISSKRCP